MLSGSQSSAKPAAQPQVRDTSSAASPREAKADPNSPAAQRFQEKLRALGGEKHDKPGVLLKQRKTGADELGAASQATQATPHEMRNELAKSKQDGVDASGALQGATEGRADAVEGELGAPRTAIAATATGLAEKFAERLALTPVSAGDTHLMLDPSRFSVSNVTISGRSGDDLTFAYDRGNSGNGGDAEPDEAALRRRLEARGIKVGSIERTT